MSNYKLFNIIVIAVILSILILQEMPAQSIFGKLEFSLAFELDNIPGEDYTEGSIVLPQLFCNMNSTMGIRVGAMWHLNKVFSAGLNLRQVSMDDWQVKDNYYYTLISATLTSLSPAVRINYNFKKYDRLTAFGELSIAGYNKLKLIGREPTNTQQEGPEFLNLEGQSNTVIIVPGLEFSLGMKVRLAQSTGIVLSLGGSYYKVDSYLFPEKTLQIQTIRLMLIQNFLKEKRYNY